MAEHHGDHHQGGGHRYGQHGPILDFGELTEHLARAEVQRMGGAVVRVTRDGTGGNDQHASETEMAQIEADYTVENNGTLVELANKAEEVFLDIAHRRHLHFGHPMRAAA